ncbi:DUF987 family protein [Escherichia coli]|nr:DUF987 family protein [Escherichia coli]
MLHPVFFRFCTGKYRWHGSTEAYTGREVQDIPGVLVPCLLNAIRTVLARMSG